MEHIDPERVCRKSDTLSLRRYILHKGDVNVTFQHRGRWMTMLQYACLYEKPSIVRLLLSVPSIDVECRDQTEYAPPMTLSCLCKSRDLNVCAASAVVPIAETTAEALESVASGLKASEIAAEEEEQGTGGGDDVDSPLRNRISASLLAESPITKVAHDDSVISATRPEKDNDDDDSANTAAFAATSFGNVDIVNALLRRGANPDGNYPRFPLTPLHIACLNGNVNLIKTLLIAGATPSLHARMTLYCCVVSRCTSAVLMIRGADPRLTNTLLSSLTPASSVVNSKGQTYLHVVCDSHSNYDPATTMPDESMEPFEHLLLLVDNFVELGVDVNAQDKFGRTALHYAWMTGNATLAMHLVTTCHARVDIRDENGIQPFDAHPSGLGPALAVVCGAVSVEDNTSRAYHFLPLAFIQFLLSYGVAGVGTSTSYPENNSVLHLLCSMSIVNELGEDTLKPVLCAMLESLCDDVDNDDENQAETTEVGGEEENSEQVRKRARLFYQRINVFNARRETPLFLACANSRPLWFIRALVDSGADPMLTCRHAYTPLQVLGTLDVHPNADIGDIAKLFVTRFSIDLNTVGKRYRSAEPFVQLPIVRSHPHWRNFRDAFYIPSLSLIDGPVCAACKQEEQEQDDKETSLQRVREHSAEYHCFKSYLAGDVDSLLAITKRDDDDDAAADGSSLQLAASPPRCNNIEKQGGEEGEEGDGEGARDEGDTSIFRHYAQLSHTIKQNELYSKSAAAFAHMPEDQRKMCDYAYMTQFEEIYRKAMENRRRGAQVAKQKRGVNVDQVEDEDEEVGDDSSSCHVVVNRREFAQAETPQQSPSEATSGIDEKSEIVIVEHLADRRQMFLRTHKKTRQTDMQYSTLHPIVSAHQAAVALLKSQHRDLLVQHPMDELQFLISQHKQRAVAHQQQQPQQNQQQTTRHRRESNIGVPVTTAAAQSPQRNNDTGDVHARVPPISPDSLDPLDSPLADLEIYTTLSLMRFKSPTVRFMPYQLPLVPLEQRDTGDIISKHIIAKRLARAAATSQEREISPQRFNNDNNNASTNSSNPNVEENKKKERFVMRDMDLYVAKRSLVLQGEKARLMRLREQAHLL